MELGGSFLTPSLDTVCFFGELRFLPQLHTHAAFPDGARHQSAQPRSLAWLLLPTCPGLRLPPGLPDPRG